MGGDAVEKKAGDAEMNVADKEEETKDEKKEEIKEETKEEDDEMDEEPPEVVLTEEEQKLWFMPPNLPDLTPHVLSNSFAQFTIPEKSDGFDDVKFEWQKGPESKSYLRK